MDPRRADTERNMLPKVGPSFSLVDGEVLFTFVIDSGNVVGPRPANRNDQQQHPEAWSAFAAASGVTALDRDASGQRGGSLPQESPAVAVQEAEPKPRKAPTRPKKA